MENRTLTCISCPLGCDLEAEVVGDTVTVTGNRCDKGVAYAKAEILNPQRVVTSNILVEGGICPLVSVKTSAPIRIGQILIRNLLGTGIDVIATREVETCPAGE